MANRYKRSKDEFLALAEKARKECGDLLELPAIRLDQQLDHREMIVVPLATYLCHLLFQRLPRDFNNPEGIQRAWKVKKIEDIREAASRSGYTAPGSIIASLDTARPWVQLKWDKDGRRGRLIVDLKQVQKNLKAQAPDEDGTMEEKEWMIGYMIDAHHRTEGHYLAERSDFEMATVIYLNLPLDEMAEVFVGVNDKQEKPSPTHVIAMRHMAGLLKGDELTAVELAERMNNSDRSILYQRVKLFDGRMPRDAPKTYVNLKTFSVLLAKNMLSEMPDQDKATRRKVIEDYFRAWRACFKDAWEDPKDHVLVKAMGFTIMCNLFKKIYDVTTAKHHTGTPTQEQFESVVKVLRGMKLDPADFEGIPVPEDASLDWQSGVFGAMSSGKGINALTAALNGYLARRRLKLIQP